MHLLGSQPRRALPPFVPWLIGAAVLLMLAAGTLWLRQQDTERRVLTARLDVAEVELARAQASLTAVVRAQAVASATAVARAGEPSAILERALALVFEAYRDPTEGRLRALTDAFSPAALSVFQTEAEHLVSSGRKLAGQSMYTVEVLSAAPKGDTGAEVRTRERWVYDEFDAAGKRARCVQEEGEQTYTLMKTGLSWRVDDVQLGPSRRTDCASSAGG